MYLVYTCYLMNSWPSLFIASISHKWWPRLTVKWPHQVKSIKNCRIVTLHITQLSCIPSDNSIDPTKQHCSHCEEMIILGQDFKNRSIWKNFAHLSTRPVTIIRVTSRLKSKTFSLPMSDTIIESRHLWGNSRMNSEVYKAAISINIYDTNITLLLYREACKPTLTSRI